MEFNHVTVLLNESVEALNIKPDGIYVDGTLGGAGHSSLILSKLGPNGRLIGIDQDTDALETAKQRLKSYGEAFIPVHNNFSELKNIMEKIEIEKIDGLLLDLGVSSYQLDTADRGFSYMQDGALDMRMNQELKLTAYDVVNTYEEKTLLKILFEYGEEKYAKKIVKGILAAREEKAIESTSELVEIIRKAMPGGGKLESQHPAKRTFQAIRIEVNNELGIIADTIKEAVDLLNPGGRIAIITFHSLEDRIVKNAFRDLSEGCKCPKEFPICICKNEPLLKTITRKPIDPSLDEVEQNPRARSAKLRVAERI